MTTLGDYLTSIRTSLDVIESLGDTEAAPTLEGELRRLDHLANATAERFQAALVNAVNEERAA